MFLLLNLNTITKQEFIQAILVSGRRHKKLNLLIQFWNWIFMKFYFEAYKNRLLSNLPSK